MFTFPLTFRGRFQAIFTFDLYSSSQISATLRAFRIMGLLRSGEYGLCALSMCAIFEHGTTSILPPQSQTWLYIYVYVIIYVCVCVCVIYRSNSNTFHIYYIMHSFGATLCINDLLVLQVQHFHRHKLSFLHPRLRFLPGIDDRLQKYP